MADLSADSLWIAVLLLPGFLAQKIKDFFLPRREKASLDQFFEVVAFAVANYVLVALVSRIFGFGATDQGRASVTDVLPLGLGAVVLGLVSGIVAGRDLHYVFARRLRLTNRTGRADVWQDAFQDHSDNWIVVRLEDGSVAQGWAQFFADGGDRTSIFLRGASWIDPSGKPVPVAGEGLLITERAGIKYIEFQGN